MKIINYVSLASKSGKYGGPFETIINQCRIISAAGYDAELIAGSFINDIPESIKEIRHDYHTVKHILNLRSFVDVGSVAQIKALWSASSADIVHISFAREIGPLLLTLFSRIRGARLILQPHGMLTSRSSWAHCIFDHVITRPIIPRKARFVALTDTESKALISWAPKLKPKIHIIGNPTSVEITSEVSDHIPNVVLFAGRLHPRKRVINFALASKIAMGNNWPERYVALGPDEGDLQQLEEMVVEIPNLDYQGETSTTGVISSLSNCGVFVLPSLNEPWGNVLVNAICLGKPVVITESSALAPLVDQYGAGKVVRDNDPQQIAEAVHKLLHPATYKQVAKNALILANSCFSNEKIKEKLLAVYFDAKV